jgi:hypothetical protein
MNSVGVRFEFFPKLNTIAEGSLGPCMQMSGNRHQYLERHDSRVLSNSRCAVHLASTSQVTYCRRGTHCYCLVLLYHGMSGYANGDDYTSYRLLNERFCVTYRDFVRRELITPMTEGYCLLGRDAI